jgi:hypothetical protein
MAHRADILRTGHAELKLARLVVGKFGGPGAAIVLALSDCC